VSRTTAALCALACAFAVLTVSPAQADGKVRIMLNGDSVTRGRHGDYTWRYRLAKELQRQGVGFDFVGPYSAPYQDPGYPTSKYADPNFDGDNYARAGWQLQSMAFAIKEQVIEQHPDVVVLEAGVNDLLHGQSVDQLEASLRTWVSKAREGKSDLRIVISPVLREMPNKVGNVNSQIDAYDARLPLIATELNTVESPVTLAPTNAGWSPSATTTWDGLHPTSTGETYIAQGIAKGLHAAGVLPDAPKIGPRTIAWPHQQVPRVTLAGSKATVSWSRQVVTAAKVRVKRVGGALRAPRTLYNHGTATFAVVKGASYDIRVQLIRGTMSGPWGHVLRVRVPPHAVKRPARPASVTITRLGVRWAPVAGARSYVVMARKVHARKWLTRRTTSTHVSLDHVAVAKVRAVNAAGHSSWRRGHR
jgi:lysophospholipase L1-like esterase